MQPTELKDQLKELIRQRDALEQEALDISTRLTAPGMPGLSGGLIDKEVRLHAPRSADLAFRSA